MDVQTKTYDVAVIGSGVSGLTAALYLALGGKKVVVLEKAEKLGGRAMTVEKKGIQFNLGGHALYRGGEAMSIFRELGIEPKGGIPSVKGWALWENKLYTLPGNLLTLVSSKLLSWSGKTELARLMTRLPNIVADDIPPISLRTWAEREMHDPMVRHFFYALVRTATYGYLPDLQLAGPVIRQLQRSLKDGVLYVDGGWGVLIEELRVKAVQAGVTILVDKHVKQIEHDGRVRGIRCSDETFLETTAVIAAIPPAEACKLLAGVEHTSLHRWKEQARPLTAACLDLGLKRLSRPAHQFIIGLDRSFFYTDHSRAARLSEDGTRVIHLIKYHGDKVSDPDRDLRELEQAMDLLQPGWRQEVVAKQYLPGITVVHDFPSLDRKEVPGPAVSEIPGLYVAGDWAGHEEMLVDAAATSAKRAAVHILESAVLTI